MKKLTPALAFAFCLFIGLFVQPAFAFQSVHLQAAIEHAEEALSDDVKTDATAMLDHIRSALGHTREALHEKALKADRKANDILHRAVRHLRQAEMQARFNNAGKSAKHVSDGIEELRKVK